jgi:hypothetical protein
MNTVICSRCANELMNPPQIPRWPREAFENVLRASGLHLSETQIIGVSILVGKLADKWNETAMRESSR